MKKYLPLTVYGNKHTTFTDIIFVIEVEDGFLTDEDVNERNYIRLVEIPPAYQGCSRRLKIEDTIGNCAFGGSFVYSSDTRFRKQYGDYPLHLHDYICYGDGWE